MYRELKCQGNRDKARLFDIKENLFAHHKFCPWCHTDAWSQCINTVNTKQWNMIAMAEMGFTYEEYECARCGAQWRIHADEIDRAARVLLEIEKDFGEETPEYGYDMEV